MLRATKPKAATPATAFALFERAPLDEVLVAVAEVEEAEEEEGLVVVGVAVEPEALVDDAVKVTPTASQSAWAAASALVRSEPLQDDWMQDDVEDTNAVLLQRHLLSVALQPPRSALAKH